MSAVSTYAEALEEAARERDELEKVLEELKEFETALEESEELRLFFYGGQIPEREKRRAIDALTEGMTLTTRNFLKVLSDNGREEIFEEILLRYEGAREGVPWQGGGRGHDGGGAFRGPAGPHEGAAREVARRP